MIKNVAKISTVTAATLLLAGCFSASSLNRDAQAPVAPQVAPAVEETVAPAKEYTLSGDFLFDFDKSNLTAKGKATLNNIAQEIKVSGAKKVTITGYTDRLGSPAYNQKLSQERANSAKAYLVNQGVKAQMKAVGRGEANQVKLCKNESADKLKSCLKPNRRVHIKAE